MARLEFSDLLAALLIGLAVFYGSNLLRGPREFVDPQPESHRLFARFPQTGPRVSDPHAAEPLPTPFHFARATMTTVDGLVDYDALTALLADDAALYEPAFVVDDKGVKRGLMNVFFLTYGEPYAYNETGIAFAVRVKSATARGPARLPFRGDTPAKRAISTLAVGFRPSDEGFRLLHWKLVLDGPSAQLATSIGREIYGMDKSVGRVDLDLVHAGSASVSTAAGLPLLRASGLLSSPRPIDITYAAGLLASAHGVGTLARNIWRGYSELCIVTPAHLLPRSVCMQAAVLPSPEWSAWNSSSMSVSFDERSPDGSALSALNFSPALLTRASGLKLVLPLPDEHGSN